MSKPRLLIHIGMPRTGSATLQRALRDASGPLLNQGIVYPSPARGPHPFKHASVLQALRSGDAAAIEAERNALLREFRAGDAGVMILSDDAWWGVSPDLLDFFTGFRSEFQVEVVAFLERPDRHVESLYLQALRMDEAGMLPDIAGFWRQDAVQQSLAYHHILSHWARRADRVHGIVVDGQGRADSKVAALFQAALLPQHELPPETPDRSVVDGQGMLTLQALRRSGLPFNIGPVLRAVASHRERAGHPATAGLVLGRQERIALLQNCQAELDALAAQFKLHFDADLPDEALAPLKSPTPAYLLSLVSQVSLGEQARPQPDLNPAPSTAAEPTPAERKPARKARRRAERAGVTQW